MITSACISGHDPAVATVQSEVFLQGHSFRLVFATAPQQLIYVLDPHLEFLTYHIYDLLTGTIPNRWSLEQAQPPPSIQSFPPYR